MLSDPERIEKVLSRHIAAREADMVALVAELVRVPTVNPPGENYREACRIVGDRLSREGFDVHYVRAEGTPGDSERFPRWNVVCRREGARPGPCVHFNGHIDVVAVGRGWTVDPFAGTVRDGRLYGRGACDMKGGLAAAIIAVEAFLASFAEFPGAIEVSATADEESGGYGGVAFLAERGHFAPGRVDHVIIPEPLGATRVCLGHRGVWWAEIETHGRIAHGSMPFLGDSAIDHMSAVLHAIETELKPRLALRRTAMPVVPDGARASTLNINAIHGGEADGHDGLPAPTVADSCRIVIDRRFLLEEDPESVKAEMRALLDGVVARRPRLRWSMRDLFEVRPVMTAEDAPVAVACAEAIRAVTGATAAFVASPGTYDQKHIDRIGRLKSCVAYGPGILDLAHQPDEWVGIDDLVTSARVMALALHRLLCAVG